MKRIKQAAASAPTATAPAAQHSEKKETRRWLIIPDDSTQAELDAALSLHSDTDGWILGLPIYLQERAAAEGWTLPHIWEIR